MHWVIGLGKAIWLVVALAFMIGVVVGMTCDVFGPPEWLRRLARNF